MVASHVVAPQPYAGSVTATHLLPHFLKLVGQVPITQAPLWQTTVPPAPGLGQVDASQVVAPQPYAGSVTGTQAPPHSFCDDEQVIGRSAPVDASSTMPPSVVDEPPDPPPSPVPPLPPAPPVPIAPPVGTAPPPEPVTVPPVPLPERPPLAFVSVPPSTAPSTLDPFEPKSWHDATVRSRKARKGTRAKEYAMFILFITFRVTRYETASRSGAPYCHCRHAAAPQFAAAADGAALWSISAWFVV